MAEISNKALAVLVVIAIVISLVAIFIPKGIIKVTGGAVDTGTATVIVSAVTAINFTDDAIDWGTGTVTTGYANCTLNTTAAAIGPGCTGFTAQTDGFTVENIGNKNVKIELKTGKNAASFIGGTSPLYQYLITNSTASCIGAAWIPSTYTDVNTTDPGTLLCANFSAVDVHDDFDIHVKITIPSDAPAATKTDIFTATATAV